MNKILVIEDDLWISNSLKLYLENSDYKVGLHHSWKNAIKKIQSTNPDLIILDINLPEKNWMEICEELRTFSSIPVIMLTARDSEYDRISWLEIWADDYIAKPFSPRELLARINSILKRIHIPQVEEIEEKNTNIKKFGNIIIDTEKKITTVNKKIVSLTKNEYDLLVRLINEDWKVITREVLMTEVLWYDKYIYDRTLDTHMKNLRKKIDTWTEIIKTIRWEWYRLNK